MGDPTKTKAAMLNELESIKGLLLEEDDIPILQEVIEQQAEPTPTVSEAIVQHPETHMTAQNNALQNNTSPNNAAPAKTIFEEQQDFFHSASNSNLSDHRAATFEREHSNSELLDTLSELEKHTAEVTAGKLARDTNKHSFERPNLAKATGENPFLPEHIRARLHGNNPPPLFANITARKISTTSVPSRQLGNTFTVASTAKSNHQHDIIESIIEKMMPEIEKELRARLELMHQDLLDEFNK